MIKHGKKRFKGLPRVDVETFARNQQSSGGTLVADFPSRPEFIDVISNPSKSPRKARTNKKHIEETKPGIDRQNYKIPKFDRKKIPSEVFEDFERERSFLIENYNKPEKKGFDIPKTKAYVEKILKRLLDSSGLSDEEVHPVVVHVQDAWWKKIDATHSRGIVTIEPELLAILPSEDLVAAALAHEIGHYICGHDVKKALLQKAMSKKQDAIPEIMFGRAKARQRKANMKFELEADALAVRILANTGYDPTALIGTLLRYREEIDTEPRYEHHRGKDKFLDKRLRLIAKTLRKLKLKAIPHTTEGYLEVYEELKARHRPGEAYPTAGDIYQHYKKDKKKI